MSAADQAHFGPMKYLGKIYIDRHRGKPLDEPLLQRAVGIIHKQAPRRNKLRITMSATPRTINQQTGAEVTACLVGTDQNGDVKLKSAVLNILSLGRIGTICYYVTAGLETKKHSRYWIRGFSCRSKDHARFICSHIIAICKRVQPGWIGRVGSKLSLVSATSRGSATTFASGTSGGSAESEKTAISGLSANQHGAPAATMRPQQDLATVKSVSQHRLPLGASSQQPRTSTGRVAFGAVNAEKTLFRPRAKMKESSHFSMVQPPTKIQVRARPTISQIEMLHENLVKPARQYDDLNLDEYLDIESPGEPLR